MNEPRLKNVLIGTEHETIEDAIAADLVSALPGFGAVTDFIRLMDTEKRPRKLLQAIDVVSSPLPFSDIFTPTNTLIYLDKKGFLPVDLLRIEEVMNKIKTPPFIIKK